MTQQNAPLCPAQTQCVGLALHCTGLAVDPHRCRQEGQHGAGTSALCTARSIQPSIHDILCRTDLQTILCCRR